MTWIRTIPPGDAQEPLRGHYERLRQLYPAEYAEAVAALTRPDGTSDSIVESHSLIPVVMHHVFAAFGELTSAALPLTRRQHEMIATLVSSLNRCFY